MNIPTSKLNRASKRVLIFLVFFIFLFFVAPNLFNHRERKAFSTEIRIEHAREKYRLNDLGDSITIAPSTFYDRSRFFRFFFGDRYRDIWSLPVEIEVLDFKRDLKAKKAVDFGGGMQTISIDVVNREGREFTLRSVDKDQSHALPSWLQSSLLRFLIRDQASAINPYGALVVAQLSEAAGVPHTNPKIYFVPYDSRMPEKYAKRMAGRVVMIEAEPNDTWKNSEKFQFASEIKETDEMLNIAEGQNISFDTLLYTRCRLFDLLIGDWDRHDGQWNWLLIEENQAQIWQPFPVDRDMAFSYYKDGLINRFALMFTDKFQSFTPDYENVKGLVKNSLSMDSKLLKTISEKDVLSASNHLRESLTDSVIIKAFQEYPKAVFAKLGEKHIETLIERRDKLDKAAKRFLEVIRAF